MMSNPATRQASIIAGSDGGTSSVAPRVAIERKNTCGELATAMRMRSPSSAPPARRLEGSTASTATRTLSCWSSWSRNSSSSVSDDLPEPPVPVMPTTGATRDAAEVRNLTERIGGQE